MIHRHSFVATAVSLSFAIASVAALAPLSAQCTTSWISNGGFVGVDATVWATCTWDPDGAGPATAVWVFGGDFRVAGNVVANHVAIFDPATDTWSALGSGIPGTVRALAVLPTGELVAGSQSTYQGNALARWDGTTWQPFGPQASSVGAFAVDGNGTLFVAGIFQGSGSGNPRLMSWDGSGWRDVGAGIDGYVSDLAARSTGVIAVGSFTTIGAVAAGGVAEWNGNAWSPLGSGLATTTHFVDHVRTLSNGDVIVTGSFLTIGGVLASSIARWNGAAWSAFGNGIGGAFSYTIHSLAIDANDDVFVGGFVIGSPGTTPRSLLRCHQGVWLPVGGEAVEAFNGGDVHSLNFLSSGDLLVGGALYGGGELGGVNVARWDGVSWHGLGHGTSGGVAPVAPMPDGSLVVGGSFTSIGGVAADHVARWDGAQWSALGAGLPWAVGSLVVRPDGHVFALPASLVAPALAGCFEWDGSAWLAHVTGWDARPGGFLVGANGNLFAFGSFTVAAGVPAAHVARYDGSAWSALGPGLPIDSGGLAALADGRLVVTAHVANGFEVRSWDGAGWSTLGGVFDRRPTQLVQLPNGDLVVGGLFTTVGGMPCSMVAQWSGVQWSAFGGGLTGPSGSGVRQLLLRRAGTVLAVGSFAYASGVYCGGLAEWDGTSWIALGSGVNGSFLAATELPGGDLVVSGEFTMIGGVFARRLARWNGTWSEVAGGVDRPQYQFVPAPNGDLMVPAYGAMFGNSISAGVAWLRSSCPGGAVSVGTACIGASGASVLTSTRLPWLGDSFHARTTNVPANAFAVAVWGLGAVQVPLASLLAAGVLGCDLLVRPDVCELSVPVNGVATTSLAIPIAPALIGQMLRHQVVPVELGVAGDIAAVTSSNALQLTIGSW